MPQPGVGRARQRGSANSEAASSERRSHNRKLALAYAQAGIPIFPSIGKVPVCLAWERLDTALTPLDRAEAIAKAAKRAEEAGREFDDTRPIGATIDAKTVRTLWDKFPDAVPSISLGPANLYVLDADVDAARNGPELMRQWLAENSINVTACPITTSQSGGEHVFFRSEEPLRSHVGETMRAMYVQVKSTGNQVVAPGAWRDDGRMYKSKPGQPSLIAAYTTKSLPTVPAPLLQLQAERSVTQDTKSSDEVAKAIEEIRTVETDDFETLVDVYGFDRLAKKDEEFATVWREPSGDTSANRFTLAKCLHRELGPAFRVADFATLLSGYDGAGEYVGDDAAKQHEYNNRSIARDFLASANRNKISDGSAFGAVDDDDHTQPAHYVEAKEAKAALPATKKPTRAPLIQLDSDAAGDWRPVDWLVDGIVPRQSLGIAFGPPDSLKSFMMIHIGSQVARGRECLGRRVEQAGVVYWFGEGRQGIAGRFKAWGLAHDPSGGAVGLADAPLNFTTPGAAAKTLGKIANEYQEVSGCRCGLVIVDTLSKATLGIKENDNAEVAMALRNAELACKSLDLTILFVAHVGKDGANRGVRGASAFEGNVDFRLEFKNSELVVERMKDARKISPIPFCVKEVEIGRKKYDEPVTSLVVDRWGPHVRSDGLAFGAVDEEDAGETAAMRRARLTVEQRATLAAAEKVIAAAGGLPMGAAPIIAEVQHTASATPANTIRKHLNGRLSSDGWIVKVAAEDGRTLYNLPTRPA